MEVEAVGELVKAEAQGWIETHLADELLVIHSFTDVWQCWSRVINIADSRILQTNTYILLTTAFERCHV